jgi:hypothetical protein
LVAGPTVTMMRVRRMTTGSALTSASLPSGQSGCRQDPTNPIHSSWSGIFTMVGSVSLAAPRDDPF